MEGRQKTKGKGARALFATPGLERASGQFRGTSTQLASHVSFLLLAAALLYGPRVLPLALSEHFARFFRSTFKRAILLRAFLWPVCSGKAGEKDKGERQTAKERKGEGNRKMKGTKEIGEK